MGYIKGEDRSQPTMFAECLDDYVAHDNPVRAIDAFVMSLDIKELGFSKAQPNDVGRPAYNPRDMLKLYIYGYLNGIRSSRKLETEAGRNIELMWLMCKLKPDFKTIADFRRDNAEALQSVFRQFVLLCKDWNLIGGTTIAVDGTKIRANNSKKSNFSRKKVHRQLKYINDRIQEYLETMDQVDEQEADLTVPTAQELEKRIAELQGRKQDYEALLEQMDQTGVNEISKTDPDARLMGTNNNGVDVCYNVQAAVDDKHNLVVDCDVTNNPTDHGQLSHMGKRAKEVLGVDSLNVLADKGYYSTQDLLECEKAELTTYVAKQRHTGNIEDPAYQPDKFTYDAEQDIYICPMGQILYPGRIRTAGNNEVKNYKNNRACKACPEKDKCTRSKTGRVITRNLNQDFLDEVDRRTQENKELYRKRQMIVEHPFGTIKRQWGFNYFLTRGKRAVKTETSLGFLAFNLRRVINILGVKGIMQRLMPA